MGIYPKTDVSERVRHEDGSETWLETYNAFDGAIRRRRVTAEPYTVEWKDCFCCSCATSEYTLTGLVNDPACRNHGYAAKRPCDIHNTPGQEWDPLDFDGEEPRGGWMPEPVSIKRAGLHR